MKIECPWALAVPESQPGQGYVKYYLVDDYHLCLPKRNQLQEKPPSAVSGQNRANQYSIASNLGGKPKGKTVPETDDEEKGGGVKQRGGGWTGWIGKRGGRIVLQGFTGWQSLCGIFLQDGLIVP